MRVTIESPLLVSARARVDPLALLVLFDQCLDQECHCIEVEPATSTEFQAWMRTLTPDQQEQVTFLLDESVKRQAREPPARSIRVADIPQPDWSLPIPRLPPRAAVALLRQPLRVLIEGVHDKDFLHSVVPHMYRAQFEEWLRQDVLKVEYRGGLESLHQAVEEECQEPSRRLRVFVMFDSDARTPDVPSAPSKRLERTCRRFSLAHHQLRRRAIDNYIPRPGLERWLKDTRGRDFDRWLPKLQALHHSRVTTAQRHHYNMKRGLSGDEEGDGGADLYSGLPPSIEAELKSGFGGDVARAFQKRMPDDWLRDDGQIPELMQLFKQMLQAA